MWTIRIPAPKHIGITMNEFCGVNVITTWSTICPLYWPLPAEFVWMCWVNLNNTLTLTHSRLLNFTLRKGKNILVKKSKMACKYMSDQGINSHGIDVVLFESACLSTKWLMAVDISIACEVVVAVCWENKVVFFRQFDDDCCKPTLSGEQRPVETVSGIL